MTAIIKPDDMCDREAQEYIDMIEKKYNRKLETIILVVEEGEVLINFTLVQVPFERIRRITGYLVGTMDNWNDAKTSEEHDRVKHNMEKVERL